MLFSRRELLKFLAWLEAGILLAPRTREVFAKDMQFDPVNPSAKIWRCLNGSPAQNLDKVVEMIGGIHSFVGEEDIVVIKPNLQWWNQGAPNLSALMRFVEIIMERKGGFRGEVVIAENCHRGREPWKSMGAGWAHPFEWNSDIPGVENANGVADRLKRKYGERFSVCHWIDVDAGGRRVYGPAEGPGYVYCDGSGGVPNLVCDNGLAGKRGRSTIMTYPLFRTDRGTTIDFRNGVWSKGAYTGQPIRYINFSAVNHHSGYCGITGSLKNYLGVADLSGGPDPGEGGRLTAQHHNFHSFPFDKWEAGPSPGMVGKAVGSFLRTIRKADLNIATAEWIGLSSRISPPVARTRAVLASKDPVALDYHMAKYLVFPNSRIRVHDPEERKGPVGEYLEMAVREGAGISRESDVDVRSFDLASSRYQVPEDRVIHGDIRWGADPKGLMNYIYLRTLG